MRQPRGPISSPACGGGVSPRRSLGLTEGARPRIRLDEKDSRPLARELRTRMTDAETILWSRLRRRQLDGLKFRRQHPVLAYVADFACVEVRLIVEVDGATHSSDEECAHDVRRDQRLANEGWRVIRVTNDDVYKRLDDVLDFIWRSAGCAPFVSDCVRDTSPVNGGGKARAGDRP